MLFVVFNSKHDYTINAERQKRFGTTKNPHHILYFIISTRKILLYFLHARAININVFFLSISPLPYDKTPNVMS